MGKITGLWLSAMMLLAVVAVSTAPVFGPGVAAASNHESGTPEEPDVKVEDIGLIDTQANTGQKNTPELDLWVTFENTGDMEGEETITVEVGGREVTVIGPDEATVAPAESRNVTTTYVLETSDGGYIENGEHKLTVNGESAGTLVVDEPDITVTSVRLSSDTVTENESVNVTATMVNNGAVAGAFEAILDVDGDSIDAQSVRVAGDNTAQASFSLSFNDSGTRNISIGDANAGPLTVEPQNGGGAEPHNITVQDAGLIDTQINTDTDTGGIGTREPELWVALENTGKQSGTITLPIEVGGTQVGQESITVPAGETANETLLYRPEGAVDEADHEVTVGGVSAGILTVGQPDIQVIDARWNRTTVTQGDAAKLTVTARNDGTVTAEQRFRIDTENGVVDVVSFDLAPEASDTDTHVRTFEKPGTYQFTVGSETQTVTVEQPATFEVRDIELSNQSVETGESVDATATVANVGTASGNYTAALTENNQTLKSKTIGPIAGGETATVSFSISFDNESNRSLAIGNAITESLAVEAEDSSDSGGGGGGGGGGFSFNDESDETDNGGGAEAPAISRSEIDNGVTVQVTADAANSTVSQSLNRSGPSETAPAFTLSELSLNVTNESDGFNATLLGPHATPNDMAAVQEDGVRGYVTVTAGANASAISRATYTLWLNESALPANGSMDAVRVFQYHNGSWRQLPSTVNATNKSIRVTAPNLSTITVVSPVANASTPTTADSSDTNMSTPTPAELTVADASLMADWVRAGFNTSARATVENPTDKTAEQTLTVTVDGDPVASRTVRLNAGEQTTVTMEFEAVDGTVAVNGVSAGDLRVGTDTNQGTGGSGADETGESGGGAEPAAETVAASGPGFTVQLVALALALVAGLARVHRRV